MLANDIGIVDPFYSGDKDEIKIQLFNITDEPVEVAKGEAEVLKLYFWLYWPCIT